MKNMTNPTFNQLDTEVQSASIPPLYLLIEYRVVKNVILHLLGHFDL